ncbi:MAG: nuclear transport factor 2 family protein [Ignavibacteria bacterium]|jgi:ketosteroid isomerase-like protein|nr:nuclear transport factor 2 family protein [Ignavibacteria bacterium]MDH7528401.1 nuclear transport factor 2 family protein [Ignavibacteria bacterium]NPV10502.1 nuclear transport factor 2 family protein [Ignavibacteria bacterium]
MITRDILLEINKNYYKAFENFDLQLMSQIWANTDDVVCIHPGWDILVGWEKVREGWSKIFMDDAYLKFTLRNTNTIILNNIGIVSCIEEIFVSSQDTISQTFVATTNLFKETEDGLKLFYHHSSPVLTNERNLKLTYH